MERAGTTEDGVISVAAVDHVISRPAVHGIVAVAAEQVVAPDPAEDRVVAPASFDAVAESDHRNNRRRIAVEVIAAPAADQRIGAVAAVRRARDACIVLEEVSPCVPIKTNAGDPRTIRSRVEIERLAVELGTDARQASGKGVRPHLCVVACAAPCQPQLHRPASGRDQVDRQQGARSSVSNFNARARRAGFRLVWWTVFIAFPPLPACAVVRFAVREPQEERLEEPLAVKATTQSE